MQKRRETQVQTALTWGRGWRALALGQLGPWHRLQAPGLKSFKSLLKRFLRHQMALKNQYFDDLSARESETYGSNCPQIIHTLKNVLVFSRLQIFEKQTGTLSSSSPDRGHFEESTEEVHRTWWAGGGRGMGTPLGSLPHWWDSIHGYTKKFVAMALAPPQDGWTLGAAQFSTEAQGREKKGTSGI